MALPSPRPGLVIGYSYLWRDEADRGVDEGRKDRPCVVVLTVRTIGGETIVTVAPITHTPPTRPENAVFLPSSTKARLGLDDQPSWIATNDLNQFTWPGFDLRAIRRGSDRFDHGMLPELLIHQLRDSVLTQLRARRTRVTSR